jgi:hypothetical protein
MMPSEKYGRDGGQCKCLISENSLQITEFIVALRVNKKRKTHYLD